MATADERDAERVRSLLGDRVVLLRAHRVARSVHRCFKGPDTNVNLHVYSPGCAEIDRYLKFRERLRTNESDRELYARTKRELAARTWQYIQHYADAKSDVVHEILGRAG
jgi:GrpB-like predicted nucleotidyltransferase (UPF0157 family)